MDVKSKSEHFKMGRQRSAHDSLEIVCMNTFAYLLNQSDCCQLCATKLSKPALDLTEKVINEKWTNQREYLCVLIWSGSHKERCMYPSTYSCSQWLWAMTWWRESNLRQVHRQLPCICKNELQILMTNICFFNYKFLHSAIQVMQALSTHY